MLCTPGRKKKKLASLKNDLGEQQNLLVLLNLNPEYSSFSYLLNAACFCPLVFVPSSPSSSHAPLPCSLHFTSPGSHLSALNMGWSLSPHVHAVPSSSSSCLQATLAQFLKVPAWFLTLVSCSVLAPSFSGRASLGVSRHCQGRAGGQKAHYGQQREEEPVSSWGTVPSKTAGVGWTLE